MGTVQVEHFPALDMTGSTVSVAAVSILRGKPIFLIYGIIVMT